eukprot:6712989-Prymnesium_polylepis.1
MNGGLPPSFKIIQINQLFIGPRNDKRCPSSAAKGGFFRTNVYNRAPPGASLHLRSPPPTWGFTHPGLHTHRAPEHSARHHTDDYYLLCIRTPRAPPERCGGGPG